MADKGSDGCYFSQFQTLVLDVQLTRDVPVSALQGVEVVHELLDRNLEGLKQTRVLKESVGNLQHKMRKTLSVL